MDSIKTFRSFTNGDLVKKTIMNIFICDYTSDVWAESISVFKSLDLPTSVKMSKGSHRGLSYQVLLDVDLDSAKTLAQEMIEKFSKTPLIVISEVMVKMKSVPIGEWQDEDLVEPGRYFDKLVSEGKSGIFVFQ